eukprot:7844477-Ditylum_brightwellii.AAC.1
MAKAPATGLDGDTVSLLVAGLHCTVAAVGTAARERMQLHLAPPCVDLTGVKYGAKPGTLAVDRVMSWAARSGLSPPVRLECLSVLREF